MHTVWYRNRLGLIRRWKIATTARDWKWFFLQNCRWIILSESDMVDTLRVSTIHRLWTFFGWIPTGFWSCTRSVRLRGTYEFGLDKILMNGKSTYFRVHGNENVFLDLRRNSRAIIDRTKEENIITSHITPILEKKTHTIIRRGNIQQIMPYYLHNSTINTTFSILKVKMWENPEYMCLSYHCNQWKWRNNKKKSVYAQ